MKSVERDEEPGALDASERAALERLRKENKDLRMDRDFTAERSDQRWVADIVAVP